MNEHNEQAQALAAIRAEIIQTLVQYMKCFENANVQASTALRIKLITEMYEYILDNINCRIYLLDPEKHQLFTIMERQVGEFMANPKAQADNRFMTACRAIDIFFQNGRILKAEQAALAQPPPPPAPVPDPVLLLREIMKNYFDRIIAEADLHKKVVIAVELFAWLKLNDRRQQQHLLAPENKDVFDDLDFLVEDLENNPANAAAVQANAAYQDIRVEIKAYIAYGIESRYNPANVAKEVENDITSILNVEDEDMKVRITLDLFSWIYENHLIQQALFAPENDYLYEDLSWLIEEELVSIPAYTAALDADERYRLIHNKIKNFVRVWESVLLERKLDEEAVFDKDCLRCGDTLQVDEDSYCHYCTLAEIDAEFS